MSVLIIKDSPQAPSIAQPEAIEADFLAELQAIKVESMGWLPLGGAYLHVGNADAPVIEVVGVAHESMAGNNVLWLV